MTIFTLSSNRAWIEHRVVDGEFFVVNYPKSIPFMWQYDKDAHTQLTSAAFFPEYYRIKPSFVSRPLYQLSAHLIGNSLGFFLDPLLDRGFLNKKILEMASRVKPKTQAILVKLNIQSNNDIQRSVILVKKLLYAALGFVVLKILIFILAGVLMFCIAKEYFNDSIALLSVAILLFSGYSISSISMYHTYELQFINPIIVIYLFMNLYKSYSIRKNIIFSFIVGLLMLGKANYAIYLAVLTFAFIIGGINAFVIQGVLLSVIVHLIPWILWNVFMEVNGMSIIGILNEPHPGTLALHPADIIGRRLLNRELVSAVKGSGGHAMPGVDFFDKTAIFNPIYLLQLVLRHFKQFLGTVFGSIWSVFSVAGIFFYKHRYKKEILLFLLIFLLSTWMQAFIAWPLGLKTRIVMDPIFIIYVFSSYCAYYLISQFAKEYKKVIIFIILFTHISINIVSNVTLPWVHPFDQKGKYILDEEIEGK